MTNAIYSGSFDPITLGHTWVISKALSMFDKVYIGLNADTHSTFSVENRISMIKNAFPNESKIEVISFQSEFLVNVCRQNNIGVSIRGIRNVKDFEYEKQVQDINERINPRVQTVYLVPPNELAGLSSSMVKSLVGFAEWQFITKDLIPNGNLSYLTRLAYPADKILEALDAGGYHISGQRPSKENVEYIINKYNANGRFYHTVQHINEMLDLIPKSQQLMALAVVFHDLVYDPKSSTNEEDSVKEGLMLGLGERSHQIFSDLIMATKHHVAKDELQEIMVDADLAILGSDLVRFNEYERQIRQEYAFVTDEIYKAGRIDFIKKILARNSIFITDEFKERFEVQARTNLNKLLLALEK